MERSLGPAAEGLTQRICHEMGISIETLEPKHMADFSRRVFAATAGMIEEYKRKFLAGTLEKFEKPTVVRMGKVG